MEDTEQQSASADQDARGFVLIKDHLGALITCFWVWDCTSVNKGAENGETQIGMRDHQGLWFSTTATVGEVFSAIKTAQVLFNTSQSRKGA